MRDYNKILPKAEGYSVEFKQFSGGLSNKELSITLCAFANTEGGVVYLGVTDNRQIRGIKVTTELLDQIQNAAREGCSPPVFIKLKKEKITDQKAVIQVHVEKSGHLHSTSSGQTYIRVGSQNKRVMGDELLRLAESKSQVSYEEKTLEAGIEIIDLSALDEYYSKRKMVSSIRAGISHKDFLTKIGLAEIKANKFYIKLGAFVLFGKENEDQLLQRDFTFVQYDVEGDMYSYREELSLPVTRLFDRLVELIRPFNRQVKGVKGLVRQESAIYPEIAIREALLNAFAHRDYRIAGLKNECRVYPDRLEIISAGSLPSMITLDNMDQRHYSRNPKIMHVLMILGLTEELGQGINLIKNSLKANGNPKPEFKEGPDIFKVIMRRPKNTILKSDVKDILKQYLLSNHYITRQQIESICGLKATKAKMLIRELLQNDFLIREGKGSNTRYKLKYKEPS